MKININQHYRDLANEQESLFKKLEEQINGPQPNVQKIKETRDKLTKNTKDMSVFMEDITKAFRCYEYDPLTGKISWQNP